MADNKWGKQFITDPVRGAFVYLADKDKGAPGMNSEPKYSMVMLIDKEDEKSWDTFEKAMLEVSGLNHLTELDKHPFIDGDGNLRDGDSPDISYDGYKGNYFVKVTSKKEPQLFIYNDQGDIEEVTDKEIQRKEFYSGAWYSLMLTPYYYEMKKKGNKIEKSVTFFISGVVKVKDDQRFGSKMDLKQAFLSNLGGQNPLKSAPKAEEASQPIATDDLKSKFQQSSKPKKANLSDVLN